MHDFENYGTSPFPRGTNDVAGSRQLQVTANKGPLNPFFPAVSSTSTCAELSALNGAELLAGHAYAHWLATQQPAFYGEYLLSTKYEYNMDVRVSIKYTNKLINIHKHNLAPVAVPIAIILWHPYLRNISIRFILVKWKENQKMYGITYKIAELITSLPRRRLEFSILILYGSNGFEAYWLLIVMCVSGIDVPTYT